MEDRLDYVYDFGGNWEHVVTLEEIAEPLPGAPRARVVGGALSTPLEDCGGVPGYEELLAALGEPEQPEHTDLVEWYADVYGGSPLLSPEGVVVGLVKHRCMTSNGMSAGQDVALRTTSPRQHGAASVMQ